MGLVATGFGPPHVGLGWLCATAATPPCPTYSRSAFDWVWIVRTLSHCLIQVVASRTDLTAERRSNVGAPGGGPGLCDLSRCAGSSRALRSTGGRGYRRRSLFARYEALPPRLIASTGAEQIPERSAVMVVDVGHGGLRFDAVALSHHAHN